MLEAVVGRPGKDVVGTAQLLDVSQALELGRVDDGDTQRIELDVSVHAVVEHLGVGAPIARYRLMAPSWTVTSYTCNFTYIYIYIYI